MTEQKDKQRKRKARADSLFGQIALRLGIVTKEQIQEALELQRCAKEHRPLGMILMELKLVTEKDLERIISAQKRLVDQATQRAKAVKEDNLFGKVAIRMGMCNEDQLQECIIMQEQLPPDRFMRLGDIMVIKGYLTVEKVKKIIDMQRGLILYCPTCDTQYNVVMFRPGASLQCYRCGAPMRIPTRGTKPDMDEAIYFGEFE